MKDIERDKKHQRRFIVSAVIVFVVFISAVILINVYVFSAFTVDGDSMLPNFKGGQLVFCQKAWFNIECGDIVVFDLGEKRELLQNGESSLLIKRVIATEGETIEIFGGNVYINGEKLDEKSLYNVENGITDNFPSTPLTVPEGHIFVMGDNRTVSNDSRNLKDLGCVSLDRVIGKVL